jgi:pilus assembly protein CpaF
MGVSEDIVEYITTKTQEQVNVIVSGGTNTGKTTLLNKLLDLYPEDHRVIFVEDTPELQNERFWDGSSLLAAREMGTGEGMLGHGQLYDHLNRITPSTIFYGEISKDNAEPATNVLNSGIKGFMCSIHANSPVEVIKNKFQQLIRQSSGRTIDGLDTYLQENIDVILQLTRSGDGTRSITDIYEPANNRWILKNSEVQNV